MIQTCDLCGFPHYPYLQLVKWINRYGRLPQDKATSSWTLREQQSERWQKIVDNHREDRQVWTPLQIFNPVKAKKKGKAKEKTLTQLSTAGTTITPS